MAWIGDSWPFASAKYPESHQGLLPSALARPFPSCGELHREFWKTPRRLGSGWLCPRGCAMSVHLPFVLGPPSVFPSGALSWGVFVCLRSLVIGSGGGVRETDEAFSDKAPTLSHIFSETNRHRPPALFLPFQNAECPRGSAGSSGWRLWPQGSCAGGGGQ